MAFRQVGDLMGWIADFHNTLGAQYRHLGENQPDERMRMTLEFLAEREGRMHEEMRRYLEQVHPSILQQWLIDSQQFDHPDRLARIPQCMGCASVEEIGENVSRAHSTLAELYVLRAELASSDEERELFENLSAHQNAEARLQTRDIARLEMY